MKFTEVRICVCIYLATIKVILASLGNFISSQL